jgi:hypothetical protein
MEVDCLVELERLVVEASWELGSLTSIPTADCLAMVASWGPVS